MERTVAIRWDLPQLPKPCPGILCRPSAYMLYRATSPSALLRIPRLPASQRLGSCSVSSLLFSLHGSIPQWGGGTPLPSPKSSCRYWPPICTFQSKTASTSPEAVSSCTRFDRAFVPISPLRLFSSRPPLTSILPDTTHTLCTCEGTTFGAVTIHFSTYFFYIDLSWEVYINSISIVFDNVRISHYAPFDLDIWEFGSI